MNRKEIAKQIVLWGVALLLALVCLRSGWLKISGNIFWIRDFRRWGYPDGFRVLIGVVELISAVLLLVPRLAAYGAALFGVVMLGAIYTHATHDEMSRLPFNIFLLVLSFFIALARRPAL